MRPARAPHRQDRPLAGRRIVLVNWRDLAHSLAGGSERYAWEVARGLVEAGADVEFWTARERGAQRREVRDGIVLRRCGGAYGFYGAVWARLIGRRLRRGLPDLVIDMDCGIPSFTPLPLPGGTPVILAVHHVHQDQFRTALPGPVAEFGRWLEAWAMPRVYRDVVTVAVSESTSQEMRRQLGWQGPVDVVHNGTEVRAGDRLEARGSGWRVCVLGRLVPHKRVEDVVRAIGLLTGRGDDGPALAADVPPDLTLDLTLDVIGAGPSSDSVAAEVERHGLRDLVRLHGFLDEAEKARVLSGADLHLCASDAEGWGLVVLEAAAHGVPTLGRDVPGIRDSVRPGRTGWLIPEPPVRSAADPGAEGGLAERLASGLHAALEQLAQSGVRGAMEEECRDWASAFTWASTRQRWVDLAVRAVEPGAHSA